MPGIITMQQTNGRSLPPFEDIIRLSIEWCAARVRNIRGIQWYAGKNATAMGYNSDLECGSAELHTGNQLINGLSTSIEILWLIDAGCYNSRIELFLVVRKTTIFRLGT